ncbi:SusD/RagB family nutrient-binding outer membrane lipoprotein [Arenibacter sp. F20364]|uniref:SusD/RagB family nutrient-binding outer membrane lipoprotein n=1 Tax=Arenibacter sp. F20364 TaxID=2926415 RepID=UPI001FF27DAF|nr:SusD/RagB family nutrient-binding outer membrane lipoprotein [Arenibacter sp. F20364]MCK0189611.1 SusD/RagB family nutrient-binding outer membrane lipoprotein [Arenibacter sp. F20364]|tara:strand:- start:524 stop:2227 length:1704 start_codon:yes stop_codon:yes gene_type:complete
MKLIQNIAIRFLLVPLLLVVSCDNDLAEINENPNGIEPSMADPNLLMSTVMTGLATSTTSRGYANDTGNAAQYTQRDSWSSNRYDWETGSIWSANYGLLRTNKVAYDRAVELGLPFHEGVTLILKSMLFGNLTDYYGDIPYSDALKGTEAEGELPVYDSQEAVYKGIIADLETASSLLGADSYEGVVEDQDLYYGGDASKWQKLANSLALRYYMRLSEKLPSFAETGVTSTLSKPLISDIDDELVLDYIGGTSDQSWPNSGQFGSASDFHRVKPCTTMTDKLKELEDPRIDIWFAPVEVPTKVVPPAEVPGGGAVAEVDGIRYITDEVLIDGDILGNLYAIYSPDTYAAELEAGKKLIDTSSIYVGLPAAVSSIDPYEYNYNADGSRGGTNAYVSLMNEVFNQKDDGGNLLKARLFSYAELSFLKAEAAVRGWGSDAEGNYLEGIRASLEVWGVGDTYSDYITNTGVAFDGTLAQIMEQKWIANMFNGDEAYLDWRRTGLPDLSAGPFAREDVMPLRFIYPDDEININTTNYNAAAASLEGTPYSTTDPNDSPYARPWIVQGVSTPW